MIIGFIREYGSADVNIVSKYKLHNIIQFANNNYKNANYSWQTCLIVGKISKTTQQSWQIS